MIKTGMNASLLFMVCFVITFLIVQDKARKGVVFPIRRIPGLDAIDEAIGRCTEMGRPLIYSFGVGDDFDTDTLASFSILGEVAKKCAIMGADIIVANSFAEVHPITEEIVRGAFASVGKRDAFKPEYVRFLSKSRQTYIAAVYGIFMRERPAANLMLGSFKSEALQMAEVAQSIDALQIAGTGRTIQVPFFIAACDYTLIGDELFAAGAYLLREPPQLGLVYAQDFGKWFTIAGSIIGSLLTTFGIKALTTFLAK